MALLTAEFDTPFTPAVGVFIVQVTGGEALLQRQNATGQPWALCAAVRNPISGAYDVNCAVAGSNFRFAAGSDGTAGVAVRADQ